MLYADIRFVVDDRDHYVDVIVALQTRDWKEAVVESQALCLGYKMGSGRTAVVTYMGTTALRSVDSQPEMIEKIRKHLKPLTGGEHD